MVYIAGNGTVTSFQENGRKRLLITGSAVRIRPGEPIKTTTYAIEPTLQKRTSHKLVTTLTWLTGLLQTKKRPAANDHGALPVFIGQVPAGLDAFGQPLITARP